MIDNDFQAQFDRANRAVDALPGLVTSAVQAGVTSALKSTDGARADNLAGASAVADHLEQAAAAIRSSIGSTGADTTNGGQGGDTLPSGAGADTTPGGQGEDSLPGGQGDNGDFAPAQ